MEVPVEKNKEYVVDIMDNGFSGEGIAKINNYTIFIYVLQYYSVRFSIFIP